MPPRAEPPPRPSVFGSPRRGRPAALVLLGLLILGRGAALRSQAPVPKEYQLKAAFLYNFTKFVEWPPGRFVDPRRPIVIGVLGLNPFGDELNRIVQGQRVKGRGIAVASVTTAADAKAVDLLFVSAAEETRFAALSGQLQGSSVLTVGESPTFSLHGGMIVFAIVADKVRFEIDQAAAEEAGLKISAQLLKLALAVHRKP